MTDIRLGRLALVCSRFSSPESWGTPEDTFLLFDLTWQINTTRKLASRRSGDCNSNLWVCDGEWEEQWDSTGMQGQPGKGNLHSSISWPIFGIRTITGCCITSFSGTYAKSHPHDGVPRRCSMGYLGFCGCKGRNLWVCDGERRSADT